MKHGPQQPSATLMRHVLAIPTDRFVDSFDAAMLMEMRHPTSAIDALLEAERYGLVIDKPELSSHGNVARHWFRRLP